MFTDNGTDFPKTLRSQHSSDIDRLVNTRAQTASVAAQIQEDRSQVHQDIYYIFHKI